ncbi:MAG: deoxyribodipyrimidine photo-lyase [Pseudomonadota bacterium]
MSRSPTDAADAPPPAIVWFRNDLRTQDNPALHGAIKRSGSVVGLFVLDREADRRLGGASRWWLHHSLERLRASLSDLGIPLVLRKGRADQIVLEIAEQVQAASVFWNRRYTRAGIEQDTFIKKSLIEAGVDAKSSNGHLLYEPWEIKTGDGGPYRVFTPFSRAARASGAPAKPQRVPALANALDLNILSDTLEDWGLLPTPNWAEGFDPNWQPGEKGAQQALDRFLAEGLDLYDTKRDFPAVTATSRMSPHFKFGEISPRAAWHAAEVSPASRDAIFKFQQELLWREFSYHLMFHYPDIGTENYQPKFDRFPWANHHTEPAKSHLRAWQRGQTGYPIVDAGMRELWTTGYMHNRVRMIVGSFLVKHLLIDWREGEAWFWDTLLDADPANNTASWQWVAGSGADAAPYFRVFNPVLQGEKFDGDGQYTRKWVPEVAELPKKYLHKPWDAPKDVLARAGVALGQTYPRPIVDHSEARQRALDAFKSLSETAVAAE